VQPNWRHRWTARPRCGTPSRTLFERVASCQHESPVSRASPGFLLGAARAPSNTIATPSEPSTDASAAAPATWRHRRFMTPHRVTLTKSLPARASPAEDVVVMLGNAARAAAAKARTASNRTNITNGGARPQGSKCSTTGNCAECCRRVQGASSNEPAARNPPPPSQHSAGKKL